MVNGERAAFLPRLESLATQRYRAFPFLATIIRQQQKSSQCIFFLIGRPEQQVIHFVPLVVNHAHPAHHRQAHRSVISTVPRSPHLAQLAPFPLLSFLPPSFPYADSDTRSLASLSYFLNQFSGSNQGCPFRIWLESRESESSSSDGFSTRFDLSRWLTQEGHPSAHLTWLLTNPCFVASECVTSIAAFQTFVPCS